MKKDSPLYVLTFITIISVVFGSAISLVHYLSLPTLERNERMFRNRVIARAFALTVDPPTSENYENTISDSIVRQKLDNSGTILQLYIKKSGTQEVGFVFKGMGFWDLILGIVVLSPDLKQIVNFEILDQNETPGLGARIGEPWFKEQFKGYPLDWNQPTVSRIVFGQTSSNGATINAITGATQTSSALERILNSELERFSATYRKQQQ